MNQTEPTSFQPGRWMEHIDVNNFIHQNIQPYFGDESFLAPPTAATKALWSQVEALYEVERSKGGVLDVDTHTVSSITSHQPGYIDQALEQIVGLQTDAPLKRSIHPFGGIRMMIDACKAYGYELPESIIHVFTNIRKTHNQGVFDAYTPEMLLARKSGIITGLPDAYGRGRIIGDYRRVALYGVNRLIDAKKTELQRLHEQNSDEDTIRSREETSEQIRALEELIQLGTRYGFDLTRPATDAHEAIQWLYLAYLAAIKEQNGAAMSLGRVASFIDIYMERDLQSGRLTETTAQELMDHFVMKLRMVRFLRTPDYNELFSGDPTWVTESIGGMSVHGTPLVTRTSFRMLHTLETLGPAPEPNLTVLWSTALPQSFKRYCTRLSIQTSSIQYENDDLMRPFYGDDYGIACCVSAMRLGKQMQFFGARANLAKALLYAMNGGRDEKSGVQVGPVSTIPHSDVLDYEDVMERLDMMLDWLTALYVNTLNVIHYMHDKYAYERFEFALHDQEMIRTMACGIAGLSVVADSLSAIKYARVRAIRDQHGLATDFEITGDFPTFGNSDERVDSIANHLVEMVMEKLRRQKTYRHAIPTLSILTITSNVVYGKKTGGTPDGRQAGEPFAPGANPMHGRDRKGALASLYSVAKLPYKDALDGISNTFSIVPHALGQLLPEQINHLTVLIDGYMRAGGHHLNVNVLDRDTLLHAMDHPEQYPQLTVRVSGYAVHFHKLTRQQQLDVVNRTFHGK